MINLLGAGAIVNSALYLIGVFVLGLAIGHRIPCALAIASAGFSFMAYSTQLMHHDPSLARWSFWLVILSQVVGAAAGLSLVVALLV